MSSGPEVRVEGYGRRYGETWATRGVTVTAKAGEILGIVGPNGAGKTTLLKTLAGLLAPTEGVVQVGGLATSDPAHRRRIGYLPEDSPLYEDMTPRAYLRFFADLHEVPRDVGDARAQAALASLAFDAPPERKIGDLSKGTRRKVAIARALVNDPDLVLFDEPASGLDPAVSVVVLDLVRSLKESGKTVIFSAHNLFHVERICDRVLILREGRVVGLGTMREIRAALGRPQWAVRTSVPVPGSVPAGEAWEVVVEDLADAKAVEDVAQREGGRVLDVRERETSLEEIFLRTAAG